MNLKRLSSLFYLLPPLCLGLWGCLLLRLYVSGRLSQVQNPVYHSITFGFALCLLVFSVAYPFLFDLAPSSIPDAKANRFPSTLLKGFLFCLPLGAFLLLPEEILSTDFLRQRATTNLLSPGALQRFLPGKPGELRKLLLEQVKEGSKDEVLPMDLLELIYLSQDGELRSLYDGQQVSIPGQWLSEDAEHFKIARLIIFCCAADGRSLTLRVNGKSGKQKDGDWVEVSGIVHFKPGVPAPELQLIECRKMDAPPDGTM